MSSNPELHVYYHHDVSASETPRAPQWVPFTRNMFENGTLGYALFPPILEGRKRPHTTFNQPLNSLRRTRYGTLAHLGPEFKDLKTIIDILNLDANQSLLFARAKNRKTQLVEYLQDLAILPHFRLSTAIVRMPAIILPLEEQLQVNLSRVRPPLEGEVDKEALEKTKNEKARPIPIDREDELRFAVDTALSQLGNRERTILTLRYGLYDGIIRRYLEVASNLGTTAQRVAELEQRALRILRERKLLEDYFVLHPENIARKEFGLIFSKDLGDLEKMYTSLSTATIKEMADRNIPFAVVAYGVLPKGLLTDEAVDKTKHAIDRHTKELREEEQLKKVKSIVQYALNQGARGSAEIVQLLTKENINILGYSPNDLIGKALIEYALHHPEEK